MPSVHSGAVPNRKSEQDKGCLILLGSSAWPSVIPEYKLQPYQKRSCLHSLSSVLNLCKPTPQFQCCTVLFGIDNKRLALPGAYPGGIFMSVGTVALTLVRVPVRWSRRRRVGTSAKAKSITFAFAVCHSTQISHTVLECASCLLPGWLGKF